MGNTRKSRILAAVMSLGIVSCIFTGCGTDPTTESTVVSSETSVSSESSESSVSSTSESKKDDNKKDTSKADSSPKTGDTSSAAGMLAVLALAGAAAVATKKARK